MQRRQTLLSQWWDDMVLMPQKQHLSPLGNYKKELPLNVLWSLKSTAYILPVAESKCRSIKVIPWPKASVPQQPKLGSPEGKGAQSMDWKARTSSKNDPPCDGNWASSRAAPKSTVGQLSSSTLLADWSQWGGVSLSPSQRALRVRAPWTPILSTLFALIPH